MLIALLCLALPSLQAEAPSPLDHAALHPATASFFMESGHLPFARAAGAESAMARLIEEKPTHAFLLGLAGEEELDGGALVRAGIAGIPVGATSLEGLAAAFGLLDSVSVSLAPSTDGGGPVMRMAILFRSPIGAAVAASALRKESGEGEASEAMEAVEEGESDSVRVLQDGRLVLIDLGGSADALQQWPSPSLLECAGRQRCVAALHGATLTDGLQSSSSVLLLSGYMDGDPFASSAEQDAEPDAAFSLGSVMPTGWLSLDGGPRAWRMESVGGRIRTSMFAEEQTNADDDSWTGVGTISANLLESIPAGVMGAYATTIDGAALGRSLASELATFESDAENPLPEDLGATLSSLFARLGPGAVAYAFPLKGIGLPRTHARVTLSEPEGFIEALQAAFEAAAPAVDGLKVRVRAYRYRTPDGERASTSIATLSLPPDLLSLGPMGSVSPSFAVMDGDLLIGTTSMHLKKEIKRLAGLADGGEPQAALAVPVGWGPDETTLTWGVFDWDALANGVLSLARAASGMMGALGGGGEAGGGLPFDLSGLPAEGFLAQHTQATYHLTRDVEGGVLTRHIASFGPETWLGLYGFGRMAWDNISKERGEAADDESGGLAAEASAGEEAPQEDLAPARTSAAMLDLQTALVVFQLDRGRFPTDLEELSLPTEHYPQGFLAGEALPVDGWGRPFHYDGEAEGGGYRLWSAGADGDDQGGQGDDVVSG